MCERPAAVGMLRKTVVAPASATRPLSLSHKPAGPHQARCSTHTAGSTCCPRTCRSPELCDLPRQCLNPEPRAGESRTPREPQGGGWPRSRVWISEESPLKGPRAGMCLGLPNRER